MSAGYTGTGDEDSAAAPGWSIDDDNLFFPTFSMVWTKSSSTAYFLEVTAAPLGPAPLISNTRQSADGTDRLNDALVKAAPAFTTGDHAAGYRLDSVDVSFAGIATTETAGDHLAVALHGEDSDGRPGEPLCPLTDPASFKGSGVHKFTAFGCPTLAADTTYFVVIERGVFDDQDAISVNYTTGAGAGAPGWSLATGYTFDAGSGAWQETANAYQIAVHGAVAPQPGAPQLFRYTVVETDESIDAGLKVGGAGLRDEIDLNGGSITVQSSGEDAPLDFATLPHDDRHLVNWARPFLVEAVTSKDGQRVRLTFSEELATVGGVPTSRFTIKVDGDEVDLKGIDVVAPVDTGDAVVDEPPPAEEPWTVDAPRQVPADWALVPGGLSAGDEFRLLFLTSTKRDATSSDIDDYNTFVQAAAAAGHADIRDYSQGFYAVASTADDDARDNTETTYAASDKGGPIYWLGGNQLADDYEDFYDGTWNEERNPTVESGAAFTGNTARVWTGSEDDGTGASSNPPIGETQRVSRVLGTSEDGATTGWVKPPPNGDASPNPIAGGNNTKTTSHPLYALSLPFVVAATAPREVPADWALTPEGLSAGDEFRLLFLTSTTRDATSSDIDDYNTFVRTRAAAGHTGIQEHSQGFYAVASTADDDARDNTETTYTASDKGVPIYWLGGNQLADDYEDFYDGTWDEEVNTTDEAGNPRDVSTSADYPWTGSEHDGTEAFEGGDSLALGATVKLPVVGFPNAGDSTDGPLAGDARPWRDSRPLYALSLPFVVAAAVEPAPLVEPQVLGSVVTLELVTPLSSPEQEVTVSYADPSPNDDTRVIEDLVGNDAESFIDFPVTNRVAFLPPPVEVPAGWALTPEGLPPGAEFRLLFVTSGERDATSIYIEDYDEFVQTAAAGGHAAIRQYSRGFFALASTAETDARDNTATTGTGVPVYWLDGNLLADNYADLYDGSWDEEVDTRDESGAARSLASAADYPWTGSLNDGTEALGTRTTFSLGGAGGQAAYGAPDLFVTGAGPLHGGTGPRTAERPLYALSQVFVVEPLALSQTSPLVPEGLGQEDRFRILFLTSTTRDATSTDIGDYNGFVQGAAAAGHADIRPLSGGFRAVASTADIDASENTWTRLGGVPIYWLGGSRLADDYSDFYDGSWDEEVDARNESGAARAITGEANWAWTGSDHDGAEAMNGAESQALGGDASALAVVGQLNGPLATDGPLKGGLALRDAERPLYGLSPVLVVRDPGVVPTVPPGPADVRTDGPGGPAGQRVGDAQLGSGPGPRHRRLHH